MPSNATSSVVQAAHETECITPRRVRHITSIQIRNLTPFPIRDAVATALAQPTEPSHFAGSGTVDDLGAVASRRHARKISTNSAGTRFNLGREDGVPEPQDLKSSEPRRRRTSTSSTISNNNLNASTSSIKSTQPMGPLRSTRSLRGHRPRTSSTSSSNASNYLTNPLISTGESMPSVFSDNSQASLEKIISSRMIETFITISIPNHTDQGPETSKSSIYSTTHTPLHSAPIQLPSLSHSRGQKSVSVTSRFSPVISPQKARPSVPGSAPPSKTSFSTHTSPTQDSRHKLHSTRKLNVIKPSSVSSLRGDKSVAPQPSERQEATSDLPETPVYFSPIHRPSTNPSFSIDTLSGRDFPHYCNTSGQFLKVEVWGKISGSDDTSFNRRTGINDDEHSSWKLLERQEIDMNLLIPLPDDLETNPSQLPSNTILITLSPPDQIFYLPYNQPKLVSRPSSPAGGYTSDPESEVWKAKHLNEHSPSDLEASAIVEISPLSRRYRHQGPKGQSELRGKSKTANWQDLFKLVNIQSLIQDNESSISEVVSNIDAVLEGDPTFPMRREVSERDSRIIEISVRHKLVVDQIAQCKSKIAELKESLEIRSALLASARDALQLNPEVKDQIEAEMLRLESIRSRTISTRTSLLSTLSTIFPIELYSPPDLLFTILDVPLPIPLNPNDPAPPLSMPEHKDVTEDAVATALGYVAQVLQILAAYVGKILIYPVTCIGSRSLIRDGISAMVGPRMFPLYSKGVDTYRFEYGVFLLNKDIEMLMSERDLRALDMRHTLPNLKNLLLTLSHDNKLQQQSVPATSSISSTSPTGLETPLRTPSPEHDDVQTPKAANSVLDNRATIDGGVNTPTASGTTTPTASNLTEDSRKQRSFLGFVPFTDFLRSRYPSNTTAQSRSSENDDGDSEDEQNADNSDGDEEDRMTIHAAPAPDDLAATTRDGGFVAAT